MDDHEYLHFFTAKPNPSKVKKTVVIPVADHWDSSRRLLTTMRQVDKPLPFIFFQTHVLRLIASLLCTD